MKVTLENIIMVTALVLTEAWFLKGYFAGVPEFEPAIAFILTLGAIFTKDPIKAKLGLGKKTNRHDQGLFKEFLKVLPNDPTLRFLKEHDFGNSFNRKYVEPLYDFAETWNSVEKEFINMKLEKKKKELHFQAKELAFEIAKRTVPVGKGDFVSVFSENMRNSNGQRPPHVIEDAGVLNEKASSFVPLYENFVRLCRENITE